MVFTPSVNQDVKILQTSLFMRTTLMNAKFKEFGGRLGVLENSGSLNSSGSVPVSVPSFVSPPPAPISIRKEEDDNVSMLPVVTK